MFHHCLSVEQINRFIEVQIEGKQIYDDEVELQNLIHGCHSWDVELVCFTYLLTKVLVRRQKNGLDISFVMAALRRLSVEADIALAFEEIDADFISYLYRFFRRIELSLDEDLVELRLRMSEHQYRLYE